jgi:uroporphyrinogen decarboxylase
MINGDIPMNSRERVLSAIHCQPSDQVPFLETTIDERIALALLRKPIPENLKGGELGTSDEPVLIGHLIGSENYLADELIELLGLDGLGMYLFLKHGGKQEEVNGHYMVAGGSIRSMQDLERFHFPDPDDLSIYEPYRRFVEKYKESGLARYCFLNIGSDPVILGMGFENFSVALYENRQLVEEILEFYTSWYARAVTHLCEIDFDFLWFGDDLAFKTSPYVSPKIFRELFLPCFRKVTDNITKPWLFHSDGNLYPILDDLLGLGMNGLHPIEPGAMDLADLKRRYGKKLCLVGHINVDTLSRGTPGEVEELVRQAISIASVGGGYIAGSSNSVPYYAKPENVLAMAQAIHKYGKV